MGNGMNAKLHNGKTLHKILGKFTETLANTHMLQHLFIRNQLFEMNKRKSHKKYAGRDYVIKKKVVWGRFLFHTMFKLLKWVRSR